MIIIDDWLKLQISWHILFDIILYIYALLTKAGNKSVTLNNQTESYFSLNEMCGNVTMKAMV